VILFEERATLLAQWIVDNNPDFLDVADELRRVAIDAYEDAARLMETRAALERRPTYSEVSAAGATAIRALAKSLSARISTGAIASVSERVSEASATPGGPHD
jgi:hypothetical protein